MLAVAIFLLAKATVTPQPAVPIGSPGDWVTTSDYPAISLQNDEEGTTEFLLEIARSGKVTSCLITKSSGSFSLDEVTCRVVSERAEFTPAKDAHGRSTVGSYSNRVRWVVRQGTDLPVTMKGDEIVRSYLVHEDGSLSDCKMERVVSDYRRSKSTAWPWNCPENQPIRIFRDSSGKAVPRRVRVTTKVEFLDP